MTFQMVSASSINICDALAVVSGIQSIKARIKAVVFSFSNPVVLACFVIPTLCLAVYEDDGSTCMAFAIRFIMPKAHGMEIIKRKLSRAELTGLP